MMKRISAMIKIVATLCSASLSMLYSQPSYAQDKPEIERLSIIDCGDGVAGDISIWSPRVNVGKSMGFAVTYAPTLWRACLPQ